MSKEKRIIRDSFPPVDHLDREELRETFANLRDSGQNRGNNPPSNGPSKTGNPQKGNGNSNKRA